MNKRIIAILAIVLCGFLSNPISTAHAAKHRHHSHHAVSHHHHRHHKSHRHNPYADNSPANNGTHGVASWYGHQFQGKRTANGEHYDMNEYTAAHRSLPLSSYVKVTNVRNQRSVVVRINDRGPFTRHRVMDLSYAAAKDLGIHKTGTAMIEITPLAMN
jgi:rare lipoprotein A